ncbi:MAG: YbhB/YbcL family Raf kinase inhibitor-like protein [Candidatus Pseudomonas phytovorans]|uniref:YbhB/YbcL family Raf kinase inhibitor-like protein n=1 Tax=Candidatus Pseudomonas phytovorans TaxID=3121377 RepID=A0AAJ5WCN0_9PSED|nr:YbhB/YbcL family Raf kinase inhibitor-like protein [Pseudomonas sp.]WEK28345.1 MAG: YbhB/YbcL family Raf kinase inhibitor-like protein [Pseudomonas sp.]
MNLKVWLFATLLPCSALAAGNNQGALSVNSSSFTDGGVIALQQVGPEPACGAGEGRTPQISWSNLPEGTRSLALIMFDPDGAKGLGVVHWLAYNIDPEQDGLKEGTAGSSGQYVTVGRNSRGTLSYRGPCPPAGDNPHHYALTLISTDLPLGTLPEGLDRSGLLQLLQNHALGAQSLVGRYGH